MKVLHISSGNLYGGIESMLVTMARHRSECVRLEQEFGLCFEGRVADELRATGVRLHQFGAVRLSRPLSVRRARGRLRDVLRDSPFDAVVCHGPWSLAVFGAAIRSTGVPIVLWVHNAHSGKHLIERLAARNAPSLVIANSAYTGRSASAWMPSATCTVINCPVDLASASRASRPRAEIRAELQTPLNSTVVILVGRMESWKGHKELIAALATMDADPRWHCWLVGGPQRDSEIEYAQSLSSLSAALGIPGRVTLCGQRTDVPSLLAAADVYCQPNTEPEPFGISLVEALSCGLPVVSTAIGGALEIVDESCGLLVTTGDGRALANALRALIDDPFRRQTLGRAGQVRAAALCAPRDRLAEVATALQRDITRSQPTAGSETLATKSAH